MFKKTCWSLLSKSILTLAGKVTNYLSFLISLKMAQRSEAKAQSEASPKKKIKIFLRAFSSALFRYIMRNKSGQLIGHFYRKE